MQPDSLIPSHRIITMSSDYPTLDSVKEGPVLIFHCGELRAWLDTPNDAFTWLAKNQNHSVSYALKHGGWTCTGGTA